VSWPETGYESDFALSPGLLAEAMSNRVEGLGNVGQSGEEELPKLLTSMRGRIKVQLIGQRLKVKGFFAVKVEFNCHRCLTPFSGRIDDKFEEQLSLVDLGQNEEQSTQDDQDDEEQVIVSKEQSFDLAPLMVEFFWLAWPYKILCRPDCAGLCTKCGANLNEGPCFCQESQPTKH
jgi:uncharacterized protein